MGKTYISFLHKRNNINNLSQKEREHLLNQLIDADLELSRDEVKLLNPQQLKNYTNKSFQSMTWATPEQWNVSDETQKELYSYNRRRAAFTPELFDSMDERWRKNVLLGTNVLSGFFLSKDVFDKLSEDEKSFYVNKKIIKTSALYPHEIPYLSTENLKKIIDQVLLKGMAGDFTVEQLEMFPKDCLNYYKQQKNKTMKESLRKYIRNLIKEFVSPPGTVFGPYKDEVSVSKKKTKPQYFKIALSRANKVCTNPEVSEDGLNCPVNYEIEKTVHARDRQYRHIDTTIEDEDIKKLFNKSIDKIVKLLLTNAIKVGDDIHLKDKHSNLNLILGVESEIFNNETMYSFPLITVMYKKHFIPYEGTRTIES